MKLHFSIILCIGIIFCLSVSDAAPATDDNDDGGISGRGIKVDTHECTGQYLKNKGLIASDVPIGNSSPIMCRVFLQNFIPHARKSFENKVKTKLPTESDCLMTEFDKSGITDYLHKAAFYNTDESLTATEAENILATLFTEGQTLLTTIATACGVEVTKINL